MKKDKYLELLLNLVSFIRTPKTLLRSIFRENFISFKKSFLRSAIVYNPGVEKITFSVRGSSEVKIDNNEKAKKERERLPMVKSTGKD